MPTNTYVELDRVTVATATGTITFTGINQGYTDLVLVASLLPAGSARVKLRVDGDTGSNYSYTVVTGNGSSATSGRYSANEIDLYWANLPSGWSNYICNFQNYSNTTTFKTILSRGNSTAVETLANVGLWRSTSAIDSITVFASVGTFEPGSTFSLYGIKAWAAESTPKATGGYVYEDSTYYYHSFPFSGTFTPNQSLSCDILQIAGGGGGGYRGGGGGAGGLLAFTSQSLTATNYAVTVGAGGTKGTIEYSNNGTNGGNSQFASLTASVGGGYGGAYQTNGNSGGSGGGGGATTNGTVFAGGSGTSGQGNAGASGSGTVNNTGGGGGGAGAAGTTPNGGNGVSTYSSWGVVTNTGQNVSGTVWYAGGGGAAEVTNGTPGTGGLGGGASAILNLDGVDGMVSTGGGGSGGCHPATNGGGNGGSGIVIVRYAK